MDNKFDLNNIFNRKKESSKTTKDIYSEMSSEELAKKHKEVQNEDNEEYIKDIDDYFTEDEQINLVERRIHLTTAKEYHLETGKKPIWNNKTTQIFLDWLHDNHPDREKYITNNKKEEKETLTPYRKLIKNQKEEEKNKKEEEKNQQLNEYRNLLSWLYEFMEKLKFDFVPTDDEIKIIEDIKELVNNG